jgi:hypothetical protein
MKTVGTKTSLLGRVFKSVEATGRGVQTRDFYFKIVTVWQEGSNILVAGEPCNAFGRATGGKLAVRYQAGLELQ